MDNDTSDLPAFKTCSKCKIEKPISDFPLFKTKKVCADSWCKECKRQYCAEWRAKQTATFTSKVCPVCKIEKEAVDFAVRARGGLAAWCKACYNEHNKKRAKNERRQRNVDEGRIAHYEEYDPSVGRTCTKCSVFKSAIEFCVNSASGKLHSWCKTCTNAYSAELYQKNVQSKPGYRPNRTAGVTYDPAVGRVCSKCKEFKSASEFSMGHRAGTLMSACKICHNKRIASLPNGRAYGLKEGDYERMLADQGDVCAICGRSPSLFMNKLAVDHCHASGVVRGLLCMECNRGIGAFADSVKFLQGAIRYLRMSAVKIDAIKKSNEGAGSG